MYCFLTRLKRSISKITHSIPSKSPICEPKPSARSIRKKIQDQNGAPGSSTIAWVKTMKAKPVPSAAYIETIIVNFPRTQFGEIIIFQYLHYSVAHPNHKHRDLNSSMNWNVVQHSRIQSNELKSMNSNLIVQCWWVDFCCWKNILFYFHKFWFLLQRDY